MNKIHSLDVNIQSNKKDWLRKNILLPPPNITGDLHLGHFLNTVLYKLFINLWKTENYDVKAPIFMDQAGQSSHRMFLKYKNFYTKSKLSTGHDKELEFDHFLHHNWIKIKHDLEILWGKIKINSNNFITFWEYLTISDNFQKHSKFVLKILQYYDALFLDKKIQYYCLNCSTFLSNISLKKQVHKKNIFEININNKKILCLSKYNSLKEKKIIVLFPNSNNYKWLSLNVELMDKNISLLKHKDLLLELPLIITEQDYKNLNHVVKYNDVLKKNVNIEIKKISSDWNEIDNVCEFCNEGIIVLKHKELYIDTKKIVTLLNFEEILDKLSIQPKYLIKEIKNKWINNLRPWCISRNIKTSCSVEPVKLIINNEEFICSSFDTWWYSSLCHIAIFGFEKNIDLLITGYDILFFWVFRMILMSSLIRYHLNFPVLNCWKKIIIHGLIRDEKNKKLSKSLQNFIPLKQQKRINLIEYAISFLYYYSDNKDIILDTKISKKIINKIMNLFEFFNRFMLDHKLRENKKWKNFIDLDKFKYSKICYDLYDSLNNEISLNIQQLKQFNIKNYVKNQYRIVQKISNILDQIYRWKKYNEVLYSEIKWVILLIFSRLLKCFIQPMFNIVDNKDFKSLTEIIIEPDLEANYSVKHHPLSKFWNDFNSLFSIIDTILGLKSKNTLLLLLKTKEYSEFNNIVHNILKTKFQDIITTNIHISLEEKINITVFGVNIQIFLVPKAGIEPA